LVLKGFAQKKEWENKKKWNFSKNKKDFFIFDF